jgi:hypothetical protein
MPPTMQIKRGTAAALASANPTPLAGELVWDSTNNTLRVGNGSSTYASLSIVSAAPADSTVSTAKIADDAVTYAKIQNVSATDRLLGRSSAGAGDVEEITCSAFARTLLAAADSATARTTLSVQPTASPAFTGAATFANTGDVVPLTVTNAGTANSFVVNDASGDTTPFVIDAAGRVGVGITPTAQLHVAASGSAELAVRSTDVSAWKSRITFGNASAKFEIGTDINNAGDNNFYFFDIAASTTRLTISSTGTATFAGQILADDLTTSNSVVYGFDGDTNTGVGRAGADILTFVTNGTERVRVDASGNVGIGAAAGNNIALDLYNATGAGLPALRIRDSAVDFRLYTSNAAVVSAISNHPLSFHTNNSERVRVDASGNVGIGTAGSSNESGFMFHVAGNAFFTSGPNATTKISIDSGDQRLVLGAYYQFGVAAYSFIAATNNAETGNTDLQLRTGTTARMTIAANGNVGIGIAPSTQLHVGSLGVFRLQTGSVTMDCTPTAGALDGFVWNTNPASYYQWNTGGTQRLLIGSDGKVTCKGLYDNTVGATNRDVFVDSGGVVGYVSSIRESKTDIVTLDDVSWLSALSPVSYRYRKRNADGTYSDEADGVADYGLIAEDVEAVRPELCFYDDVNGEPQLRGVTYSKLITPMLRYIQQLEARIAALEERLSHG